MADVFISYKAEDRRRVQPLVQALQADGYSVWWDEHIGTGDEWRQTIEKQLDSAKCVIVVWSKRSAGPDGHFVRDEASRAQRRHVYVPVILDAVSPPLGFGESQATSLKGWNGDRRDPRYETVLGAVRRIAGDRSPADLRNGGTNGGISRRAVVAGGAAATAAVIGVGGWTLFKSSSASAASNSIAVLPFANLSGDPAQAYFADGIAEELRSALARINGLKVVGRTSSEAVREDDAETAAKKLGVVNILTGSVRESPSTIRVSAQLIDGGSGLEKWSASYDRPPGDAIKIQTDIAQNVATALSAALASAAKEAVAVGGTQNPDAQRLFIQVEEFGKSNATGTEADYQQALQMLDSAIRLDPNYADAYALKSLTFTSYANAYAKNATALSADRAESMRLAKIALRLAPKLPIAHAALSLIYSSNLQLIPAFDEAKKAAQLAPGDASAIGDYSSLTTILGDQQTAFALSQRAIDLDPLNPGPYNNRISVLYYARRYRDVVDYSNQLQRRSPLLFKSWGTVANALILLGRLDGVQTYLDHREPDYWSRLTGEAILFARTGNRKAAEAKLGRLQQIYAEAASYQQGQIYAQLGDKEQAFASLDRGFEIKDAGLVSTKVDPFLDPLRSDPRFDALLKKMNFPA
jgi:serine/threonine-protein kinase